MNVTTCTIGELLVKFLAKGGNQGFSRPGEFRGPYPNRALAASADQMTKPGFDSVLFSYVGNDVSDEMNIARLEKDGVNVSGIAMLQKAATGSALVSYHSQTQRDLIFNMPNSACGLLTTDHINEALLNQCQYFHIMGLSLFSFRIIDTARKAIENIKGRNSTVSFDSNICKEILSIPEMPQAFEYIPDYTDILLPSDGELDYFGLSPERNERTLADNLLKRGMEHVVIKRGSRGTSYFSANETHHAADFDALVVDPADAEDCFGATFANLFLNDATLQEALKWANTSGSLAISQRGPMEGTSAQAQIRAFPATQHP